MPDESCRKCGGLLLAMVLCAKCKATVQDICRICGTKTMERFHDSICFRKDEYGVQKTSHDTVNIPMEVSHPLWH